MTPEETSGQSEPPAGRQPLPRRRGGSIDGVMGQSQRRPMVAPLSPRPHAAQPIAPANLTPRVSDNPQNTTPSIGGSSQNATPSANSDTLSGRQTSPPLPESSAPVPIGATMLTSPNSIPSPAAPMAPNFSAVRRPSISQPGATTAVAESSDQSSQAGSSEAQPQPPAKPKRHWPWRKIVIIGLIMLVIVGLAGGATAWWKSRNQQVSPQTVFLEALENSLAVTQVQVTTTSSQASSKVGFDFGNRQNPLVSSQATARLFGASFRLAGYGSAKNTYVSYSQFPTAIANNITSVATNAWISLRAAGTLPPGASGTLANLADPRYQTVGPLLFGNLPMTSRIQLAKFAVAHHVYSYNAAAVSHTTLNGAKVLTYPIKLNASFLKIMAESVGTSQGFTPTDLQAAVDHLDVYNGAKGTVFVSANQHRMMQLTLNQAGQTTTITYSAYNKLSLPGEPQTRLTWPDFAPVQLKIEQQAAAHQTAAALDGERQANLGQLHDYLAAYFTATGFYPTFPELDDQSWVAKNMPGIDPDVFRDPLGTALGVASAPKKAVYAYQPVTPTGQSCSNDQSAAVSALCLTYKLTATLSTGKPYVVIN